MSSKEKKICGKTIQSEGLIAVKLTCILPPKHKAEHGARGKVMVEFL
jgi:hypothetical protein